MRVMIANPNSDYYGLECEAVLLHHGWVKARIGHHECYFNKDEYVVIQ